MEENLFNDLIQSLNEAAAYAKGDKTKGRSMIVSISDEEVELDQMIFQQLEKLSIENKEKVIKYANELLQATAINC